MTQDLAESSHLEGINISIIQHSHRKSDSDNEMADEPSFLKEIHNTLEESGADSKR